MSHYYDPDGNPLTFDQWAARFEDREPGSVWDRERRLTVISYDVEVSTVWLGLDHQWQPDGPPLIFETMIFGGPHGQRGWLYATREKARAGHERACRIARGEADQ